MERCARPTRPTEVVAAHTLINYLRLLFYQLIAGSPRLCG